MGLLEWKMNMSDDMGVDKLGAVRVTNCMVGGQELNAEAHSVGRGENVWQRGMDGCH